MATNFPTSLDNFSNPTSGDKLDSPSHSSQHSDANDAIEALEAKIGIGLSTAGSAIVGQVLTAQGGGTAIWATTQILNTKNALINGSFSVAQRGTAFTSSNSANNDDTYVLDRWYILSDGNDAIDVTQETSIVPTNGQFAIALDVETVNKKFGIAQIIENKNCLGLIGNTLTFSFKAKVSSTTKLDNVKAAIVAWSGTADSVTSDIISAWEAEGTNPTLVANATYENTSTNLNVTTSYATYSVTASVDTASTKNIIVFIWSDVTDTTLGDFLYISETKLEIGSKATDFDYAGSSFQNELFQCQRYFYVPLSGSIGNLKYIGPAAVLNATTAYWFHQFPQPMRTQATMAMAGTASDYIVVPHAGAAVACTGVNIDSRLSNQSVSSQVTVASGLTTAAAAFLAFNTTNGAVQLGAEL